MSHEEFNVWIKTIKMGSNTRDGLIAWVGWSGRDAEVDALTEERDRLRAAIESAPHGRGCVLFYSASAPAWMKPGVCDCWKALAEVKP